MNSIKTIKNKAYQLLAMVVLLLIKPGGLALAAPDNKTNITFAEALVTSILHPGTMPSGVNDWDCKPSKEHLNPVILIHGTTESSYAGWARLAPTLKKAGYCVFALDYGKNTGGTTLPIPGLYGMSDIKTSNKEVIRFINKVIKATHAAKVDLVGHSQGAIQARLFVQNNGGYNPHNPAHNLVDKIIGLSPSNHGTTINGLADTVNFLQQLGLPVSELVGVVAGKALAQQMADSEFIKQLNAHGDTRSGIKYTVIATEFDTTVTPYTSQFLAQDQSKWVKNITLQKLCPNDHSTHLDIAFSPNVIQMVLNALSNKAIAANLVCQ